MADIPKIRFKGFTEPWEQRKVKDISDFIDGNYGEKYPRDDEFVDSGIPFFTSAVTGSEGIFNEKNVKFISTEKNRELTKAQSQGGDLILTNRGASMGVIAEIPEKYGLVNIGPQLTRIRGKEKEANNKYLLCLFQTSTNNKKLTSMNAGSAMPFIGLKGLGNIDLLIPQYDEQLKIGEYFSCLDHFITLHQRKCDDTKELKKYMLQKMFPKNGEKFPEIRFKGFTEAWEQRKLSDVTACIKNGYTYKADGSRDHRYKITRIESISSGVINTEKLGSSDEINENYRLVDGDILFSHINSLPYIANTALYTADLGEIYHGMNLLNIRSRHEEIDSHFLLHLLKKESTRDWFRIIAKPAVNQASISTTEVGAFAFLIPRMEEQKKISSVLDNLDNLITLHQRKCDTLKELKKYMLQNMFPKKG